jgi:predicted nucleic acid-binding protein
MTIFVDTSAFYAVLSADDQNHSAAHPLWVDILERKEEMVCTNYILVETLSLLQRRLGIESVRAFQEDVFPFLNVEWLGEGPHLAAVAAMLTAGRRQLSLVDCASFEAMRRLGLTTAFAFDPHFTEQGFHCIPK